MKPIYILLTIIIILSEVKELIAQNVGVGTPTPHPSAKLDVTSTNSGFLFPRLTTAQRNAITSPSEGLAIFNTDTKCLEYWNATQWVTTCQPTTPICYQNCLQIKNANPASPDGVYTIDPDCGGPFSPFQCYCDMTTDGGGWTLVLNYLHQGGTNPALNIRTVDLPLLGSTTLGVNEGGTAYCGHSSNTLLNAIPSTELRFFGKTSNHPRIIHFKSSLVGCLSYFKTGIGSSSGINVGFTTLSGHPAFLPNSSANYNTNQGNIAMTQHAYYLGSNYHWNIQGDGFRWEVDDFPVSFNFQTHHQIYVC